MQTTLDRTKRSLYGLLLVLGIFMVVADTLVISKVQNELINDVDFHTRRESQLFSKLVSEALTKGDYTSVEFATRQWGKESSDIVRVTITTANGFTLAQYTRDGAAPATRAYHEAFEYGDKRSATIDTVMDVSVMRRHVIELAVTMVVFSVFLTVLLVYFIRYAALKPLHDEIREHRRTEEALALQTQSLALSNQELETFSYSVAHDLRSPLRAITSFGQILQEEAAKKLNKEEHDYLDRIINAGQRMSDLIDDLLELARISRTEMRAEPVDLSALAQSFLDQQQRADPDRNVRCVVAPHIMARGDPRLLRLVMENLLGNAWKYTANTEHVNIEFGSADKDGQKVFYVRDNGIGFDMQFVGKLFQPFQRLDNSPDFKGSGIGLANVKRIIERHGGTIWADAESGRGATFYFTLPVSL